MTCTHEIRVRLPIPPQTEKKMTTTDLKLERLVNVDAFGKVTHFLTDATKEFVKGVPEVEWYAIKNVLQNFGYTVIEINKTEN